MAKYTGKETLLDYIKSDIPDGDHTFQTTANNELVDINVEFINYYDDIVWTGIDNAGNDTPDERMLVLKFHKNLTVAEGAILRPTTRKKGMFIYVKGKLENRGTISMTARGAIAEGQNVYICKDEDRQIQFVPATGSTGGARVGRNSNGSTRGNKGQDGINRSTGGGGSGAVRRGDTSSAWFYSGAGGQGTSYSGGSGGGGCAGTGDIGQSAEAGASNGGKGGNARARTTTNWHYSAGGGAGNPGGKPAISGSRVTAYPGEDGTGGLLIIYASQIINNGIIQANGSDGGSATKTGSKIHTTGGGGSGGGSVNLFFTQLIKEGIIEAKGGSGGVGKSANGGSGGNGSITITIIREDSNSHLIKDGEKTYTFDLINQEWIPIDPSQKNFENVGIVNLGNLIVNTSKVVNFKNKLGNGQMFKEPVNFRAYRVIKNISIA